jgi:vacuolar protein sorting-associated protein 13D
VFEEVLRPRFDYKNSEKRTLQVEIHVFISPTDIKGSILLNKLRLVGILDLILELKSFVIDKLEEEEEEEEEEGIEG